MNKHVPIVVLVYTLCIRVVRNWWDAHNRRLFRTRAYYLQVDHSRLYVRSILYTNEIFAFIIFNLPLFFSFSPPLPLTVSLIFSFYAPVLYTRTTVFINLNVRRNTPNNTRR